MPDEFDEYLNDQQFHDVDGKLAKLEMKIDAMDTMSMMEKANAALPLMREILDLFRDLRNELRSKV